MCFTLSRVFCFYCYIRIVFSFGFVKKFIYLALFKNTKIIISIIIIIIIIKLQKESGRSSQNINHDGFAGLFISVFCWASWLIANYK